MNSVANLSLAGQSAIGEIAFIDLKAQQRRIRDRVDARIAAVLDHGRYIGGPEIVELETLLAERTGAAAVTACASGTAALIIPLLAMGVGQGDAVFVPSFTYNATANAVLLAGAIPVFVDIDRDTYNMDPADLDACVKDIKEKGALTPRAVIPVDMFGSPADYPAISAIAEREEMIVLSDAAQSFGGRLNNRWVGNLAPVTATSFFPGKSLGAYGDAGAIFGQDAAEAEQWASIRWHGTDSARKNSVRVGFNGRMDSIQAAVLLEKLAIFDEELEARHRIAAQYAENLSDISQLQAHREGAVSGFGYYSLCVANRDQVVENLRSLGVPTAVYYETPLHKMPAFENYSRDGGLPVTEDICRNIFSLPMHPYLTPDQVNYVCEAVRSTVTAQ